MSRTGYLLVESRAALQEMLQSFAGEQVVACDLEADSLHHYREKVCLLQFSTATGTWLVDPFACSDLSLLLPLFADPAITKVFHGADYDVRSLYRDFGIEIAGLFDTMIASQFLGEKEWGLAALIKNHFGVSLDKKFQTADWSKRPFSREMMDYAALDTAYLIPLAARLVRELEMKGRRSWVEEECQALSRVRAQSRESEPLFLRCKGAGKLQPRKLALLEELLQARDREAQRRDRPPFKVIGSEHLLAIAQTLPQTLADLKSVQGLPEKLLERSHPWILAALAAGHALPEDQLPVYPHRIVQKKTTQEEKCLKDLKAWRSAKAALLGIDSGVLMANTQLEKLCESVCMRGGEDCRELLKTWQLQQLWPEMEALFT